MACSFHHRRGVIVNEQEDLGAVNIDACSLTLLIKLARYVVEPMCMCLALMVRLSFAYNDHIMHELGRGFDQRNVAIAVPLKVIKLRKSTPVSMTVNILYPNSQTVAYPQKGSEINKAYEECWIGKQGYTKADGSQQRWSCAFIGDTVGESGEKVADIFLVDLPDDDHAFSLEKG